LNVGTNDTICRNNVSTNFGIGVFIGGCSRINLSNNTVSRNTEGAHIETCDKVMAEGNKILDNHDGMNIKNAINVTIRGNKLKNNESGMTLIRCQSPGIYFNNFINNTVQVTVTNSNISWHGRWNVTGNYWSDYKGTNFDQYLVGYDPYVIDANNKDYHPFKSPWLAGDIIHDGRVNYRDLYILAAAYGSNPQSPNWNPHADLNEDGVVDNKDLAILKANYGKTASEDPVNPIIDFETAWEILKILFRIRE